MPPSALSPPPPLLTLNSLAPCSKPQAQLLTTIEIINEDGSTRPAIASPPAPPPARTSVSDEQTASHSSKSHSTSWLHLKPAQILEKYVLYNIYDINII
jgi:hypothetical protein